MLKNLKGSPLSVFRHCETLARQGLALGSPGAPLGPIFLVRNFFKKFFFKKFRFSSTVKEYLTLGSLFAIFEPWIWRRLGPVPACCTYSRKTLGMADYLSTHPSEYEGSEAKAEELFNDWLTVNVLNK